MKKLAIVTVAALGLSTLAVTGSFAQAGSTDDFQRADENKDGVVSMNEAMGVYPTLTEVLFNQADTNKDGNLDEGEYAQLQGLSAGLDTGDNNNGNRASSQEGETGNSSSNGDNGSSSNGDNSSSGGGASASAGGGASASAG